MSDIIIYRRKRGSTGQWKCREKAMLKVELQAGRFVVFAKLANMLDCNHNDAVMFGFSKKDKCAYIFKETPEEDSYYLRQAGPGRPYFRFTSKNLAQFFTEIFDLEPEEKVVYFEAGDKNNKGWLRLMMEV